MLVQRTLRSVNTLGQMLPHRWRRFLLDKLGLGRMLGRVTANARDTMVLPNGLAITFNPLMHWSVVKPEAYEPEVLAVLSRHLEPGMTFYDVGANIGLYALMASTEVGPNGRVLAFEPEENNLRFLKINAKAGRVIDVHGVAVGASDGTVMFDRRGGAMSGRVMRSGDQAAEAVQVSVRSIDSLVEAGAPPPNAIKIDVEGLEGDVLKGATETLARYRPLLICEMHLLASDAGPAVDLLRSANYRLERLDGTEIAACDAAPPCIIAVPEPSRR